MKKGFAIIELFMVVGLLSAPLIALIATPVILNVKETAKEESYKNSAYGVIDAAKLYYVESLLDDTIEIKATGNDATKLNVSGIPVTGGTWDIDESTGIITLQSVVLDDYTCTGTVNSMKCIKNK